jgi:hypothetical protein
MTLCEAPRSARHRSWYAVLQIKNERVREDMGHGVERLLHLVTLHCCATVHLLFSLASSIQIVSAVL